MMEIAFFLLPVSSIIFAFVIGIQAIGTADSGAEQAGAAIGTAIGGVFIVGLMLVIGLVGGIILHLIAGTYDKKATASGIKQMETFSNKNGVALAVVSVFGIAIIFGAVSSTDKTGSANPTSASPTPIITTGTTGNTQAIVQNAVSLRLAKKGMTKADIMTRTYTDSIDFTLELTNNLPKDIRAFTGKVTFSDLFDRKIIDIGITYEDGLKVGETKNWDRGLDYNQFMDSHQRLASIDKKDLRVTLALDQVIYTDGTKENF